jgi:hypothetical protein
MVTPTRHARVSFLRLSDIVPVNGRKHKSEPGTAFKAAETTGLNLARNDFTYWERPNFGDLNPQKREGPRPLWLCWRLWGLIGLRGGPGRFRTFVFHPWLRRKVRDFRCL